MDDQMITTGGAESAENGQGAAEQAAFEPATVFGFAPEQEAAAPAETQPAAEQADAPEGSGGEDAGSRGTVDEAADDAPESPTRRNAFARQREELERKHREDPATQIGEQLIRDVMRQNGCTRAEAVEQVNQRFVDAYAKRENVGTGAAKILYRAALEAERETERESAPAAREQQRAEPTEPQARAQAIVEELLSVRAPEGFDMDAAVADPAFQDLLVEFPAAAAVRIYAAERREDRSAQRMADRLRARESIPASTRPVQSVSPEPNYREMSSADFQRLKERALKSIY